MTANVLFAKLSALYVLILLVLYPDEINSFTSKYLHRLSPRLKSLLEGTVHTLDYAYNEANSGHREFIDTVETRLKQKISLGIQDSVPFSNGKVEKCIIVGVDKTLNMQRSAEELGTYESLIEMMELCKTAHLRVAGSCIQRMSLPNPKSYLGEGKMAELRELCKLSGAQVVVVDDDITPRQQKCIERALSRSAVQNEEEDDAAHQGNPSDHDSAEPNLVTRLRRQVNTNKNKKGTKVNIKAPEELAPVKVLDRTAIILDIFAQHAQSREGQLQVELAMMEYRSTRGPNVHTSANGNSDDTVGDGKGSSGAGLRGPGESKLELDKRKIKTRILLLKEQIAKLQLQRQAQRSGRARLGVPLVALVGYTNAGKSTILNRLTNAGVLAENMLFATLDPTTRKIRLPALTPDNTTCSISTHSTNDDKDFSGDLSDEENSSEKRQGMEILLTDTVGFISKLPSSVVAAFRATLESVADADVLIHVCDRSSPSWEKQRAVVMQELARIAESSLHQAPIIEFWNKIDALPADQSEAVLQEIKSLPIEMDLITPAQIVSKGADINSSPAAPSAGANNADTVDDEMFMCAVLPDSSSQLRKEKKQTKNQKRSKNRVNSNADQWSVDSVSDLESQEIIKIPFNTPTSADLFLAMGSGDKSIAADHSAEDLQAEPSRRRIFSAAGSAITGQGFDSLVTLLEQALSLDFVSAVLHIPFEDDLGVTSTVLRRGVVNAVRYTDTGTQITCRLPMDVAESLVKYRVF